MQVKFSLNFLQNLYNNKLNKRIAFLVSSFFYLILIYYYISIDSTEGKNLFFTAFILSTLNILIFSLTIFPATLDFKKLCLQMIVPLSYVFSSFLLLYFFPNLIFVFKLAFVLFSFFIYYFLLLSFNVFFVVSKKGGVIPLLRPARTTFLLIQLLSTFFLFTAVYKIVLPEPLTEATFLLQTVIVFFVTYSFANSYWWSQDLEDEVTSFIGNESIVVAFLCSFVSIALSFYPTESFFRSLGVSVTYYICINFFQSIVTHKFFIRQLVEYLLLGLLALFFILFV